MSVNTIESSQLLLASPKPKRLLLAFLLAPLAGPLGISIGFSVPLAFESSDPAMLLGGIPLVSVIATPFVYFFSIVVGLPFFLLLHLTLGLSRLKLIITWAVVGMLSFGCLTGFQFSRRPEDLLIYLPFALGGAVEGYAFWAILSAKPSSPAKLSPEPGVKMTRSAQAPIRRDGW